jgi:hypothetical protein
MSNEKPRHKITRKATTSLTVLVVLTGVGLAGCTSLLDPLDLASAKKQAELGKTETELFAKAQPIPRLRDSDFQALQAFDEAIALALVKKAFAQGRIDELPK